MKLLVHPRTQRYLDGIIGAAGGSFLFHGPRGIGKRTAALEAARQINCQGCGEESCHSCMMAKAGNHPDIIRLAPNDKDNIGIELIHELQHQLQYSQYEPGSRRVVIIAGADKMSLPAQNALLKLLEEPPAGTTMILTASSPAALLETIVSRCRLIFFAPVQAAEIAAHLQSLQVSPQEADEIIKASGGRVGQAIKLAGNVDDRSDFLDIYQQAQNLISAPQLYERLVLAAQVSKQTNSLKDFIEVLSQLVRSTARNNPVSAPNLEALDRLRRNLAANVNPKVALEAFAVEATC